MGNETEMKWQPIPSLKSEQIDDLFKNLYGVDRKTSIVEKTCVSCGAEVAEEGFRDDVSLREFHISGLCQVCQDKVFGFEETLEK
jgi:hypothetical protein|tara:strand:+ start:2217 stop:2471 length:255 start_codon:yes stop_codon:yes gene_type:complete